MTEPTPQPIDTCLERWHLWLRGDLEGGLDALLHEDCTFFSPIVFTPQEGREVTALYLQAAKGTLAGGGDGDGGDGDEGAGGEGAGRAFGYVTDVRATHQAMLEFETSVGDTYVNGVDIITCDDDARITEFKVMLRPLRAVNLVHEQMRAMLESMQP
jgi:hypothetical protein